MKILFVVSSYHPDGAGSGMSVRNLAEGCARAGHDVVVVRLAKKGLAFEETINGVKIYHRRVWNIYSLGAGPKASWQKLIWHGIDLFNPLAAFDFYRIVRREKPNIINTSVIAGFSTSLFYVSKLMGVKLVHTMRDYYLMCAQSGMFKNGCNCERICRSCQPFLQTRKMSSRCVDLFLANSDYVAQRHQKFGALPPGAPCHTQFNMNRDDEISAPRAYPARRPVRFGFIGRLASTKGIEVLLRAVEHLPKDLEWELKIAGEGPQDYVEKLKNQCGNAPVTFLGYAEPEGFYHDIDILICPSVYGEPLPRVVYEGYRAALPVIAARTGGTPEIIEEGHCALSYEAEDDKALGGLVHSVASDKALYETLSKGAAEKAKIFTRSAIITQFIERLQATLDGSP